MQYTRLGRALTAALLLCPAQRLAAQCADGSLPPCARPQSVQVTKPATADPNRVAVLPFRVTTADTLLGEGFAELLAPEFTGEGGPRAIDMSTTLSAWRRAGGGLRSPLPEVEATRLARQIGAGRLVQGSITGIGGRLRVTAGLFDATSGRAIGAIARADAPTDSIDALLRQVATNLLTTAGAARASDAARLTSSPQALRLYLEGLALWRRGQWARAERAFVSSYEVDSTFASPAYQAYMLTSQLLRGTVWAQRTIALRHRLPLRERTIIEEFIMPSTMSLADRLANGRRVAERLGDAPEAWFLYGDNVYHTGQAVFGPDSAVAVALDAFNRAIALDPVPVFMYHVMESAVMRRDTATARRMLDAYERIEGEEGWARSWVLAAFLGDAQRLARLRQRGPDPGATVVSVVSFAGTFDSRIPLALVEEGYRRLEPALAGSEVETLRVFHWLAQRTHGRPDVGERALAGSSPNIFRIPFVPWAWMSGDAARDAEVLAKRGTMPMADSLSEARRRCAWAVVRMGQERSDSVDVDGLRPDIARCTNLVRAWKTYAAGTMRDSGVARLDTLVRTGAFGTFIGVEHRLLARVYESRGELARALDAIGRYPRDYSGAWLAPTLREQGRLALLARDTTLALRAYGHYLELYAEAEPSLAAERDSVRAIVTRLRRR